MPTSRRSTPPTEPEYAAGAAGVSSADVAASADFAMPGEGSDPDPRQDALAALLAPPPVVVSDLAGPVPVRPVPVPSGRTVTWMDTVDGATTVEGGARFMVLSKRYPRMWPLGNPKDHIERREAHSGDTAVLPDDEHTQRDVLLGYLLPL